MFNSYLDGGMRYQDCLDTQPYNLWSDKTGCWAEFYRIEGGYIFRMLGLADFFVSSDGNNCICYPEPEIDIETQNHIFRTQVQPFLWNRQGKLVFHASCVEHENHAYAFMGDSGMGKSTLATALAKSGKKFLTDDGLLVHKSGEDYMAYPNDPSIRLWDNAHAALLLTDVPIAPAISFSNKLRILASPEIPHCKKPHTLKAVFSLSNNDVDELTILPLEGMQRHLAYSNCSFNLDVWDKESMAKTFRNTANIASDIPTYKLDFPRRFEDLPMVITGLEDFINCEIISS